jgi:hypothetical protein
MSKKAGDGPKWWCHENDSSAARRVRANAGAARDGRARRGQAGVRRVTSHLAAGGSRDAPTRTYPGVRVPPSSWRRGGRPAGAPGSGGGGSGAGVPVGVAAAGALGGVGGVGAGVPASVAAAGALGGVGGVTS